MLMEKRKLLVNKFSSFISFTDNRYQNKIQFNWNIDCELENNMKLKIEADPDAKESFWAQYFLKILLSQSKLDNQADIIVNPECSFPIAKRHLSAYLQEACFRAAKDIYKEFKYIRHKYSLEEYFQIANIAANSPGKFFRNFSFDWDKVNVESYAITGFKRFIRNQIYQQDLEARRTRYSNYGLLKNLSPGEFHEALVARNFSNRQITIYSIVWRCFVEIFHPENNRFTKTRHPSEDELQAIANYYNQRCIQYNISQIPASKTTIQEILSTCISAAKNYRTKQYFSLEEDYYSISDGAPSTLDILIKEEECQQVREIVEKIFTDMPKLCQIVFKLWQGLNLTQTEIANLLHLKYPELQKQYQVARQLKKYTRNILKSFISEWNETSSKKPIDSEQDIERVKSAFDKCIKFHCEQIFFATLDRIMNKFTNEEKENVFNNIKFGNVLVDYQESKNLEKSLNDFIKIKLKLLDYFQQYLEDSMDLEKNSLSVVNHKILEFVNEWIKVKQDYFI